ncbi:MAG: Hsp70 family protein [Lachnoclostridium sp.]|nr:Hsp70 family protein [Lachnoclostridium sp.]
MASLKIIYGIDLGTTNSAITRFENGKAVVKKNSLQSDTTPSVVAYRAQGKAPSVGSRAKTQLEKDHVMAFRKPGYKSNVFHEFKRVMGTDHKFFSSALNAELTPEDLSAEVLKELRKNILDDEVSSAVITVPAMFNNTQKDATKRAAKLAGFDHVELIQEPVAASVAYGLSSKMKNAYWVVFDFGGGTFDAALMRITDGIMQAIDTAGNNKLGGKDIDNAIIEQIMIPYFRSNYTIENILTNNRKAFAEVWKAKAEEAKINLSFNSSYELETDLGEDYGTDDLGDELALSLTITQDDLERVAAPIYQKAIDITKELLARNGINGKDLGALILVGGPTHSPIVRRMLREQVTPNVDTSIDPMTCVAAGAAIYGSTIDVPEEIADTKRDRSKVQLAVTYQSTSVETEEWVSVSLLRDKCDNYTEPTVRVEFARTDGLFTSPASEVDAAGDVVSLMLKPDATNTFDIRCYDSRGTRLECEPSQISIIQGVAGLGDAVIPMALGIGATNKDNVEVFIPIQGLEKSRKLPASGSTRSNGLRTQKDIRPGVESDTVRMSLYQTEDVGENVRVLYCQRIYDVLVTGEDVPVLVPAESVININLHAERSGTIDKFEIEIPSINFTLDLTERMSKSTTSALSESFLVHEIYDAKTRARRLDNAALINRIDLLEQRLKNAAGDRDALDGIFAELQSIGREIDHQMSLGEWDREAARLKSMFAELSNDNVKYGNADTTALIEQIKKEMDKVLESRNVQLAKDLYSQMWNLDFRIAEVEFYIAWIQQWNSEFARKNWTNPSRARQLVDNGLSIIRQGSPTADALRPIAFELNDMLPEHQKTDTLH